MRQRTHPHLIDDPVLHRSLAPVNHPIDHEAVAAINSACTSALGREPGLGRRQAPCDANIMAGEGEATVVFGPMHLAWRAHVTNEFVPVDGVEAACKVYARLIVD